MSNFLNIFKSSKSNDSKEPNSNSIIDSNQPQTNLLGEDQTETTQLNRLYKDIEKPICVIGGLQYIGAHIVLNFLRNNYKVIVLDSVYNTNFVEPTVFCMYQNYEYINIDYSNYVSISNILWFHQIDTIIYPFRNSFSNKDSFTTYSNTIYPLINILKAISLTNTNSPYQINKIICASNCSIYNFEHDVIHYNNINSCNSNVFYTFMKERLLYDFHKSNPQIQITILRLASPCGIDSTLYNSILNINYLKFHKSLQNNIIFSLLTGSYLQITKYKSSSNNSNIGFGNNINFIEINDISSAFLKVYKNISFNRFEILTIAHNKPINMFHILKQFGTGMRFYVSYSNSMMIQNTRDLNSVLNYTKDIINWEPVLEPLKSFSYINTYLSNKLNSIDLSKLEQSNNMYFSQTNGIVQVDLSSTDNVNTNNVSTNNVSTNTNTFNCAEILEDSDDEFDLFFEAE